MSLQNDQKLRIKLVQIDGELPNLALMKIAHYFKHEKNAEITFTRSINRDIFEPRYDFVFGSALFATSLEDVAVFKQFHPEAVVGGSAVQTKRKETVENHLGIAPDYPHLDYSIYPEFKYSIGRTQLGCTRKCGFCSVWKFEGDNRPLTNINKIWRGAGHPKSLILLDNDFQKREGWQSICREIIDGSFEVSFIQGINARDLTNEHGEFFKQMKFRDKNFSRKRFYCAWDNEADKEEIERGLNILEKAGYYRSSVTPYFLANYFSKGLTDDVWNRFIFMSERGLRPYLMIYQKWTLPPRDDLKIFQNFVNTHNAYRNPTREGFAQYKKYYLNRRENEIAEDEIAGNEDLFSRTRFPDSAAVAEER